MLRTVNHEMFVPLNIREKKIKRFHVNLFFLRICGFLNDKNWFDVFMQLITVVKISRFTVGPH
jgi:hypothetical protein